MTEKKFKQVCECKNCGNEAEMEITCSLQDVDVAENSDKTTPIVQSQPAEKQTEQRVKGQAVCSHCGNEADMWIDL